MISHKYKCIYIHVPKTAGHSIVDAFGMPWGNGRILNYDDDFLASGPIASKQNWMDLAVLYKDYFIFAVVRNPWDRFVSGWKYCESTKKKTIEEVLRCLPQLDDNEHDFHHITRRQRAFLYHRNTLIPHYVIRMERLQEGFDEVCDRIGMPRTILKRLNTTEHGHYRDYFVSDESKWLFSNHFAPDINTFGYTF